MNNHIVAVAQAVVPVVAAGVFAVAALIALSFVVTGNFVFESAAVAGGPEHVSPYFGGVVGAMLTAGLIALIRTAEVLRGSPRDLRV